MNPVNVALVVIIDVDVVVVTAGVTTGAVVGANGVNLESVIGNVVSVGVDVIVVVVAAIVVVVVNTGIVVVGTAAVVVVVVGAVETGLTPYVTA